MEKKRENFIPKKRENIKENKKAASATKWSKLWLHVEEGKLT